MQLRQQLRQTIERQRIRAVGKGARGPVVHFEKNRIDSRGASGARQRLDKFRLAAARAALPSRQLHRMRHVKNDRIAGLRHDRKRAHIDNEIVVPKRRASLGQNDLFVSGAFDFFHRVGHFPGRKKLALLEIYHATGAARSDQQVGLPRKKCGHLQYVAYFRGCGGLRGLMDVGEQRNAETILDFSQDGQAGIQTRPAKRRDRRAIGLVVRSFEHEWNLGCSGDFHQALGHAQGVRFAFNDARTGEQNEWLASADAKAANRNRAGRGRFT